MELLMHRLHYTSGLCAVVIGFRISTCGVHLHFWIISGLDVALGTVLRIIFGFWYFVYAVCTPRRVILLWSAAV
jgi:hypothetical protein